MQGLKTIIKTGDKFLTDFLSEMEGDDPIFIRNCEKVIQNRIKHWNPKELFIIDINTIFGSASIQYKDRSSNVFTFWSCNDELEVTRYMYDSSTTIYLRTYKGYEQNTDASYIKKRKREEYRTYNTSYGTKEYKYKPIEDGLIIFYTKNTLSRDQGSIMFFYKDQVRYEAILVSLSKNNNWNVSEAYEISASEIQQIINN